MSEEQLKKLNERLAKGEELLKDAMPIVLFANALFKSESSWVKEYLEYLKTYKK